MSVRVAFACGHTTAIRPQDTGLAVPACPTCGERRVRHTDARAPNFRGVASGPSVRTEALGPMPMTLTQET